jgi:hypothetical protein
LPRATPPVEIRACGIFGKRTQERVLHETQRFQPPAADGLSISMQMIYRAQARSSYFNIRRGNPHSQRWCEWPNDIVYCRWSKSGQSSGTSTPVKASFSHDMTGWFWVERAFLYDYPTYPGCFVLPRSLIEEAGGWNEQLSFQDDMEFMPASSLELNDPLLPWGNVCLSAGRFR